MLPATITNSEADKRAVATALAAAFPVQPHSRLMPAAECERLLAAVQPHMVPAGIDRARRYVEILLGAYPAREFASPEIFAKSIAGDLAGFPEDVLRETVVIVRRTCKFAPSIAEVYQVADGLMQDRRQVVARCKAHLDAHKARGGERPARAGKAERIDLAAQMRALREKMQPHMAQEADLTAQDGRNDDPGHGGAGNDATGL